jgi:type II secretory pathway component GspD/PulD (secretin)
VKPILTLLTAVALGVTVAANAAGQPAPAPATPPRLSPEAEAAARKALENAYAETTPTNKVPTRVVPGRITNAAPGTAATATNKPGVTAKPVGPAETTAAAPTPAPAPAAPQVPAPAVPIPGVPAVPTAPKPSTNTGARVPGVQATPVVPGLPGVPGTPAPRNVAGAPQPAAGVAAPGGAAAANAAEDISPAGQIKFQDADIVQVLEIYQELTGRTVLKPSSLPQVKISIRTQTALTRAEAVLALDSILSMNGVTMVLQGEKFVKAVAEAQAGQQGAPFNDLPGELLPDSGTFVTHVVQLTNSSPNDILPIIQPFAKAPQSILTIPSTGMLVLRDYAENVKRMLELIAKVDVVPIQEFESVVIPIKYALAGDIATVLGSLTAGGGGTTTVGQQQTRTGLSGPAGGVGGAGGIGGFGSTGSYPGQPGYSPNQAGGARGLAGGAAGRSSFQNRLQQIVNRATTGGAGAGGGDIFVLGQTKIIADERINALLIFASKSDLSTVSNIINQLDVVLAQVLIEAIVMEVSLGNSLDYGFSYVQTEPFTGKNLLGAAGGIANIPFLKPSDFLNLGSGGTNSSIPAGFSYAASFANFDATAKAFAGDSRVKILQRPRIQTSHAVEANLFVGQTRPYPTGTSYGGIGGSYSSIQQLQIGVTLSVLPLINAEGLVVMDIRQKIQDVGEEVAIANVGNVPSTIDREANAKVAVRDGETVMLGGMIAANKNKTKSGVPILKDIPFLGALFRTTTDNDSRRELIVLIRPTVLQTPEAAATFAKEQRTRMPATSAAADEFEASEKKLIEEERKRVEKQNKKLYKKEGFLD